MRQAAIALFTIVYLLVVTIKADDDVGNMVNVRKAEYLVLNNGTRTAEDNADGAPQAEVQKVDPAAQVNEDNSESENVEVDEPEDPLQQ
jgi:hypothetical protein